MTTAAEPQQGIKKGRNRLGDSRCFEIAQDVAGVIRDPLRVGLADLVREVGGFVGDQVVEVAAKAGDRRVVVVHHREAKTDHQNERHEVGEVESAAVLTCGKRRLDAVPDHQDGGEGPEQVLPHAIEDPEVLLHERIDGLKYGIKEVHGISWGSVVPGLRALTAADSWRGFASGCY